MIGEAPAELVFPAVARDDGNTVWRRLLDADIALRGLSVRRLAWTALVILLFTASSTLGNSVAADGLLPAPATITHYFSAFLPQYTLWMLPALFAGVVADRVPAIGVRRAIVTLMALLAAGQLSVVLQELLLFPCDIRCEPFWSPGHLLDSAARGFDIAINTSAVAIAYYAQRRDARVAAALCASESARVNAERDRISAALQVMQARIEPAFLLQALCDVGTLHTRDPASAERLLDLLIAYLRAALPPAANCGSTVQRELLLLRTWLDIAALRADNRLVVECDVDRSLNAVALPPLTLVPLAGSPAHGSAKGVVQVKAADLGGYARITLAAHGDIAAALAPRDVVAGIRERLQTFYGGRATLVVERAAEGRLSVTLEVPA